jgi:hypothetical protein
MGSKYLNIVTKIIVSDVRQNKEEALGLFGRSLFAFYDDLINAR